GPDSMEVEESLLDALLGKALAGDQMNSRIEGLFEDLD
nr:Chain B, Protein tofu-1 [Caenorhabditis elegans]